MAENSTQNIETGGIQEYRQPDLTYRMGESTIVGKITDKIESVKQSILHILSTERYSNPIYDDDYGVELEKYIGQDKGTVIADIENTLNEALTQDDRITKIKVNSITDGVESNSLVVEFTVYTIYGEIGEVLNVVQ